MSHLIAELGDLAAPRKAFGFKTDSLGYSKAAEKLKAKYIKKCQSMGHGDCSSSFWMYFKPTPVMKALKQYTADRMGVPVTVFDTEAWLATHGGAGSNPAGPAGAMGPAGPAGDPFIPGDPGGAARPWQMWQHGVDSITGEVMTWCMDKQCWARLPDMSKPAPCCRGRALTAKQLVDGKYPANTHPCFMHDIDGNNKMCFGWPGGIKGLGAEPASGSIIDAVRPYAVPLAIGALAYMFLRRK